VLLNAGTASDLPSGMLTAQARAVVVPDVAMSLDARTRFTEQLESLGFNDVTILSGPSAPAALAPDVAAA
jgi:succinoglycan biosynthesis transport protein ExoP